MAEWATGLASTVVGGLLVAGLGFHFSRFYYRSRLFGKLSELTDAYSSCPRQTEQTYSSCICVHRYPASKDKIDTYITPIFRESKLIDDYLTKCKSVLSDDVCRAILAILERTENLNKIQSEFDFAADDFETQKNNARQFMTDWCYVVFMLKKLAGSKNKFVPINRDVNDFNDTVMERFSVSDDENKLFKKRMIELGYNFQSFNTDN